MRLLTHPNAEVFKQRFLELSARLRGEYEHNPREDNVENDFWDFF